MGFDDLNTGKDLLEYALDASGQSASINDDYGVTAKASMNQAYWALLGMEPWMFALADRPKVFTTHKTIEKRATSIVGNVVTMMIC